MARPKKEVLWKTVEALVQAGCDQSEIAQILNVSADTLQRASMRDFGVIFSDRFKHLYASQITLRLKTKMLEKALGGDTTMLIWCSKNLMGWSDKGAGGNEEARAINYTIELKGLEHGSEQRGLEPAKRLELAAATVINENDKAVVPTELGTPKSVSPKRDV